MPDSIDFSPRLTTRLTPWLRSWRAGLASIDDVVAAITSAPMVGVEQWVSVCGEDSETMSLTSGFARLSRVPADEVFLVLPVPGDVRGLPTSGPFALAAMRAGEAIVAGQWGIVPLWTNHVSGSGDAWQTVAWRLYRLPASPPTPAFDHSLGEADVALSEALRTATDDLIQLDVARWHPELDHVLRALRGPLVDQLPPGFPPRASRLHARALMLDTVLRVAEADAFGGAVTAAEASGRAEVLRGLAKACRPAILAACHCRLTV
ncbi:hypothetical protein [Stackebrandtia soli]|uniref:hypothetical protein n=1 Tax=Stackebrandtia soli TaxID=1892856 RepID=UPI0039EAB8A8